MNELQNIFMIIFIFVTGMSLVSGGLPRWVTVTGGVCGIIVALMLFLGNF